MTDSQKYKRPRQGFIDPETGDFLVSKVPRGMGWSNATTRAAVGGFVAAKIGSMLVTDETVEGLIYDEAVEDFEEPVTDGTAEGDLYIDESDYLEGQDIHKEWFVGGDTYHHGDGSFFDADSGASYIPGEGFIF